MDPSPGRVVELVGVLRSDNEELVVNESRYALQYSQDRASSKQHCRRKRCASGKALSDRVSVRGSGHVASSGEMEQRGVRTVFLRNNRDGAGFDQDEFIEEAIDQRMFRSLNVSFL